MKINRRSPISSLWTFFSTTLWLLLLVQARENKRANQDNITLQYNTTYASIGPNIANISFPSIGRNTAATQFCLALGEITNPLGSSSTFMAQILDPDGFPVGQPGSFPQSNNAPDIQTIAREYNADQPMLIHSTSSQTEITPTITLLVLSPNSASINSSYTYPQFGISMGGITPLNGVKQYIDCTISGYCAFVLIMSQNPIHADPAVYTSFQDTTGKFSPFQLLQTGNFVGDLKCSTTACFVISENPANTNICLTKMVLPNTLLTSSNSCFASNNFQPSLTISQNGNVYVVAFNSNQAILLYEMSSNGQSLLINGSQIVPQNSASRANLHIETNPENDLLVVAWDEMMNGAFHNYFVALNVMGMLLNQSTPQQIYPNSLALDPQTTFTLMTNHRLIAGYRILATEMEVRTISLPPAPSTTSTQSTSKTFSLPTMQTTQTLPTTTSGSNNMLPTPSSYAVNSNTMMSNLTPMNIALSSIETMLSMGMTSSSW